MAVMKADYIYKLLFGQHRHFDVLVYLSRLFSAVEAATA
jgi:hypothetical protein